MYDNNKPWRGFVHFDGEPDLVERFGALWTTTPPLSLGQRMKIRLKQYFLFAKLVKQ